MRSECVQLAKFQFLGHEKASGTVSAIGKPARSEGLKSRRNVHGNMVTQSTS